MSSSSNGQPNDVVVIDGADKNIATTTPVCNDPSLQKLLQNFDDIIKQGRALKNPAWAFFCKVTDTTNNKPFIWYYCTECFQKKPSPPNTHSGQKARKGILVYKASSITASLRNHVEQLHNPLVNKLKKVLQEREKSRRQQSESHHKLSTAGGALVSSSPSSFMSGGASTISTKSSTMDAYFKNCKPFPPNSWEQKQFEANIVRLTASAYTPLSLVENPSFRRLITSIEPRLNHISRTKLTRKIIPNTISKIKNNIRDRLSNVKSLSLSYDLWMTRKTEEIFSLNAHFIHEGKKHQLHLGMPWSRGGTDGQKLAYAVEECISEFNLGTKVIGYTCDGGSNLKTCKLQLDEKVSNSSIFNPPKPQFETPCIAHILSGACKCGVIDVKTDTLCVERTRNTLQKCITWTKKSQKGANSLVQAQELCSLRKKKLLTPVKTRFAYLSNTLLQVYA